MENPIILGTLVGTLIFIILKVTGIIRLKLQETEIRKLRLQFADELEETGLIQIARAEEIRDEVRASKSPLASIGNFVKTNNPHLLTSGDTQECAT